MSLPLPLSQASPPISDKQTHTKNIYMKTRTTLCYQCSPPPHMNIGTYNRSENPHIQHENQHRHTPVNLEIYNGGN